MPRYVDKEQRLQDIAEASLRLLTRGGPAALTLKNLAAELGGSITLVTHFYPNRAALVADFIERFMDEARQDILRIDTSADDPKQRLRAVLEWLLPTSEESARLERMRILILAQLEAEPVFADWVIEFEQLIRDVLRDHVQGLVVDDRVAITVDALRTFSNGLAISTVEHPEIWTAQRQIELLEFVLQRLELDIST
jgi:AcrR family transcriptional regulator